MTYCLFKPRMIIIKMSQSFLYSLATIIVVVRKISDSDRSLSVKNLSRSARSLTRTFAIASYSP